MRGIPNTPREDKKELTTAQLTPEAAAEVLTNSERLNQSLAKMAGAITVRWHAEGCAPLTDLDQRAAKKSRT